MLELIQELTKFEQEQCKIIARYFPFSLLDVQRIYKRCSRSFDKTVFALQYGSAYNNIDLGIAKAIEVEFKDMQEWQ